MDSDGICSIIYAEAAAWSSGICLSSDNLGKRIAYQASSRHLRCPRSSRGLGCLPRLPGGGAANGAASGAGDSRWA